jgi:hypothetical protein
MSRYRHVNHNGTFYFNIGILPDGTLVNLHGYSEEEVRAAVTGADARRHERRSNAAKKAAVTRASRVRLRVGRAAHRIVAGQGIGNRTNCYICGRALSDPESMKRGIGDNWRPPQAALATPAGPKVTQTIAEPSLGEQMKDQIPFKDGDADKSGRPASASPNKRASKARRPAQAGTDTIAEILDEE